ncbi:MAG TPA: GNAT family N-acetyltransferase [Anaerolineae bacterium]|nr:GNAT family N-acetyltransferase [Anaerolineae bacterium]
MFRFHDPGRLVDGDLELVLYERYWGDPAQGKVPAYRFLMTRVRDGEELGAIELRVGNSDHILLYAGHIGYGVEPLHRGHHYAARSVCLLLPLASWHRLSPVWITCNPDNFASRRTCELAGGVLVEIVDLPADSEMYRQGERQKCRYRLEPPGRSATRAG